MLLGRRNTAVHILMGEMILSIGGLYFRLVSPTDIAEDKEIQPFILKETAFTDITVFYQLDSTISKWKTDISFDTVNIRCNPKFEKNLSALRGCLIPIPIEQILLAHDRFLLHASFITTRFGGVLFSGS